MLVSGSVAPPFFCLVRTTPTLLRPCARSIIENGYPSLLMNAHHDSQWPYTYKWVSPGAPFHPYVEFLKTLFGGKNVGSIFGTGGVAPPAVAEQALNWP